MISALFIFSQACFEFQIWTNQTGYSSILCDFIPFLLELILLLSYSRLIITILCIHMTVGLLLLSLKRLYESWKKQSEAKTCPFQKYQHQRSNFLLFLFLFLFLIIFLFFFFFFLFVYFFLFLSFSLLLKHLQQQFLSAQLDLGATAKKK